jgi:putative ATP-binding cassette transporter
MKKLLSSLRIIWGLAIPYFRSEERWSARLLLGVVIALQLGGVGLSVALNIWYNTFYNSLQNKDWALFVHQLILFCGLAAAYIVSAVYQLYLTQWLTIRWRRWMTERYLEAWLSDGTHYRMHLLGGTADNPDQRISEDIRGFITNTLDIGVGLLGSVVSLGSFIVVLWNLSANMPLMIGSLSLHIPGYLVWGAFLYAVVGTLLTHLVGRVLIRLNFDQQRYEADFRFSLVRVREHTEQIALLGGELAEHDRLFVRFSRLMANWYAIMTRQKKLTFLTAGYGQAAVVFPYVLVSPFYFAGQIQLGGLMQTASAFGQVQSSFSFFVTAYTSLASWKAIVDRLSGFQQSIERAGEVRQRAAHIAYRESAEPVLAAHALSVQLPEGEELVHLDSLRLRPGERMLVTGPSGSGKTSLLRALSGAWEFGTGEVVHPVGQTVLMLPQRAYLPLGTLRGALTYPAGDAAFADAVVREVLEACGLGHLLARLDEEAPWTNQLSGGEQQRVGFARALLAAPDWLLLDEATASLDEPAEDALYRLLRARLPNAGIISVGHRPGLTALHDRALALAPRPRAPQLQPGAAAPLPEAVKTKA